MAMDALVKPFLRLPLFQGLKPLQLTEIVRRSHRIVYRPGDLIIEEDKAGDAAVIIISGEAVRLSSTELGAPGEVVPEGAIVGELAMLVETVHSTTVIARSSLRALKITRDDLHALMIEDPALAEHFMEKIGARLQKLATELKAIDQALTDIARYDPQPRAISQRQSAAPLH